LVEVTRLISRNFVEIDKEKPLFQLFFLRNNENQTVIVEEVEEIDFGKVNERLEQGESVFITLKRKEKVETRLVKEEALAEPWYFTRI
jgi:hypothetical protein